MKISLIADQAIGEADRTVDGLGFDTYAQVLSDVATNTRGPFTIGVFGEWGTGKTSLMRLIEAKLGENDDVVTVWFNAWRYEQEDHPIVPLIGTVVQALEAHRSAGRKLGDSGTSLIRSLRAIAYGFSAKSKVSVPGFAEFEASFVAKDMIDRRTRLAPDPLLDRSLYYGAFNSLDELKLRDDLKVVILIDDLDRCFPDQAIRLLESIKLVLAQPGFIFVLGVARKVVEGYLQHRYSADYGIKDFKGELYLDKIVQLPFHIPPSIARMADFCKALLADQPAELVAELDSVLPVVAEALGGNPRAIVRFINNILVDHAISTSLPAVRNTIPIHFFAVSRCLEHRWPEVFDALTAVDGLAEQVADWATEDYAARATTTGNAALVASRLLSDRALQLLLYGHQGRDWLTNSTLRNASVSFLVDQQRFSHLDTAEVRVRYDAYLSFSEQDRPIALELAGALTAEGARVLVDGHTPPGVKWADVLTMNLHSSKVLIYCIGRPAGTDAGQRYEIMNAVDRTGSPIIPVILPGAVADTDVPEQLRDRQWLDLRAGITPEGVSRLVHALRRH
ncbi:P-loop NTPase fold protein [Actinosynnema sp. NPDC053489]|uniref:P-loop NTPase fold protein n=1 Tax=Actinosynnema sp. NPDC053489 TaxID=3363916 RepID=UPI0037C7569A